MLTSAIYAPATDHLLAYHLHQTNPQLQLVVFLVHANSITVDKAGCSFGLLSNIVNFSS